VIILHNDPIPSEIWQQINHFPKVYFMQGSPLKLGDLDKARIQKASSVVILGKYKENDNNSHSSQVDADTIFIYKTVKLLNPQIRIITELASMNTISFLSLARNHNIKRYGYIVSEPFASGEIYVSTMLDSLIC
jgi:potassium large conductance calcium-activated channel subfamily M alpha protein 1